MDSEIINHVDSFDENCWRDLLDYSILLGDVAPPSDVFWNPQLQPQNEGSAVDVSVSGITSQLSDCAERECLKKRGRSDSCSSGSKACRERLRREKLNDKFAELSSILEPGRPVKTDKLAILGDAIRVLSQLKSETMDYKEMNEKLLEEIKTLKVEKNELREEKQVLQVDKERIEQQLKTMTVPHLMPAHPPMYQAVANKMAMYPGYGYVPMWQYLTPSVRDTSQDQELRPPAA